MGTEQCMYVNVAWRCIAWDLELATFSDRNSGFNTEL